MSEQEVWKNIPGYKHYQVSNTGKVKSLKRKNPIILRPSTDGNGYYGVCLLKNNRANHIRIHQLVLLAFVGPPPTGMECCHNDGDKKNNSLDNLRYDTHQNNLIDAFYNGSRTLKDASDINYIRDEIKNGRSIRDLSEEMNINYGVIMSAATGKSYAYIDDISPLEQIPRKNSYDFERARKIREEYASGNTTMLELSNKYDIDISAISLIINGKRLLDAGGPIKGIDYALKIVNSNNREKRKTKTISLYETDLQIINQYIEQLNTTGIEISFSDAIRSILRQWKNIINE